MITIKNLRQKSKPRKRYIVIHTSWFYISKSIIQELESLESKFNNHIESSQKENKDLNVSDKKGKKQEK